MWSNFASVCGHFIQFGLMAALILGSQAVSRRAQDRRVQAEANRLRTMLRVGLEALHRLYDDNLRLLAAGDRPLLSGRNQMALLRIQFGRLVSLDEEHEIAAVLAANIAMETAEAAMAVAGKPVGGVAFLLPEGAGAAGLEEALLTACATLDAAAALFVPANPESVGTERRVRRASFGRAVQSGRPVLQTFG